MTNKISLILFLLIILSFTSYNYTQEENNGIKIISPKPNDIIAGKTRIIVEVPAEYDNIDKIEFYIDKKLVYVAISRPYAFTYDFGPVQIDHIIKILAYSKDHLIATDTIKTQSFKLQYLVNVKIIEVHASAFNKKKNPISNLTKEDFIVYDNDIQQEITHFQKEKVPIELVFLIDKSLSMKNKLEKAKIFAKEFLKNLITPEDKVALIAFNDEIHLLKPFNSNLKEILESIDLLQAEGGTSLNDAIAYSLSLFTSEMKRKAIVVITDGKDESSHLNSYQMLKLCEKAGIPIFSIAQGEGLQTKELKEYLELISQKTGGITLSAKKIEDLKKSLKYIEDVIRAQYLLGYQVNENHQKGLHYIKVSLKKYKYDIIYTPTIYLEE